MAEEHSPTDVRLLLVDDHPVVATGINLVLKQRAGYSLAGALAQPEKVATHIEALHPDVLILDLAFNGRVKSSLVAECRQVAPDAIIVVFTSLPSRSYRQSMLAAGADAFVSKEQDLDALMSVVDGLVASRGDARRQRSFDDVAADQTEILSPLGVHLTRREQDIARLLSRGESVAKIADVMGISVKTAAVHRDNLRKKLGCQDSRELIARLARSYGETA